MNKKASVLEKWYLNWLGYVVIISLLCVVAYFCGKDLGEALYYILQY